MKKILSILLTFVVAFTFIANVHAVNWTMKSIESIESGVKLYDGLDHYNAYTLEKNGSQYQAYCIDSPKVAPSNGTTWSVSENQIKASEGAFEAGLVAIVNKASNYTTSVQKSGVNWAIRIYVLAMKQGNSTAGDNRRYYNYRLYNTAAKWLSENKTEANKLSFYNNLSSPSDFFKAMGLSGKNAIDGATAYNSDVTLGNGDAEKIAKELFVVGLKAAASGSTSNQASAGWEVSAPIQGGLLEENTPTHFIQYDYYTFTLNEGDSLSGINVSCTNCESYESVYVERYYVEKDEKIQDMGTANLAGTFSGTQKITLKIVGKIARDKGYDCSDLEYTINYTYTSPSNVSSIYILTPDSGYSAYQRFLAFKGGNATQSDNLKVTMDFCDDGGSCIYETPSKPAEEMTEEEYNDTIECCEDWLDSCNADSTKNADHCSYYEEYCGACDTEIVVPTACTYVDGEEEEVEIGYVNSAIDDEGKENIKFCLLALKKDEEGNSYQTEESKENNYCKVYCKEDYKFNLPKALSVNSGSYFHLDASISGTKSCYTSEINTEQFKADINELNSKYSSYSTAYESEYNKIVSDYNSCINMETNYDCFDPKIEYSYEESYNDLLGEDDEFVKVGEVVDTNVKTTKCNGEINDNYSCSNGGTTEALTITKRTSGGTTQVTFNATKYVKSTITKTGNYKTPSVFYTQRGTDIITKDETIENGVKIDGLPVEVKTEKGEHKFTLTLKNIGEYYDKSSCKSGRLIGDENSIYNSQNEGKTNAEYQCHYYVNCPECDFGCEGDLCEMEFCDGEECEATCLGNGCAYDNEAGLSYVYRTVSLNSINPTSRDLGYNWDTEKGEATIANIESTGEKAYETPEYSFTLTPALISEIKEYNKSQLNNGGYADNSLTCHDDEYGNEKVNCESNFIKKLQSGEIGNTNNQLTVPDYEEKFTSWLDSDYCNGACTITKRSGIGPSWK